MNKTFFSWYIFHLAYFAKPQLILTDRSCWLSCLVTIPTARSEPGKPWNMYFLCYPVLLLINEKILCIFLLPHDQTKPWLSMARAFDPFRPLSYSSAPFHQGFFLPGLFVKITPSHLRNISTPFILLLCTFCNLLLSYVSGRAKFFVSCLSAHKSHCLWASNHHEHVHIIMQYRLYRVINPNYREASIFQNLSVISICNKAEHM